MRGRARAAIAAGLLIGTLSFANAGAQEPGTPGEPPPLIVRFLNVGQGDAAWLTTPDGRTVLIDCGPLSYGRRLVADMQAAGVERVDVLAPSHAHADHMGGCIEVVRQMPVGELLWTGQTDTSLTWRTFWAEVAVRGIPVTPISIGQVYAWGNGATATVLNPRDHSDGSTFNEYDDSQVLLVEYFGTRIMFVGDLHVRGEQRVVASGMPVHAHVLKVSEHGSGMATSAAFLDAVRPRLAVLSYGQVNAYQLPDPEVLLRLEAAGAQVVRTAEQGAVTLTVSGYTIQTERAARTTAE